MSRAVAPVVPIIDEAELIARFRAAMDDELTQLWTAGDMVLRACRDKPPSERRAIVKRFADAANCTVNYVAQRLMLSESYGTEARTMPGVNFSLARAAMLAARRIQRKPGDVLKEALDNGWTVDRLAAIGRKITEAPASIRTRCAECGARVSVRFPGGTGLRLPCPVCAITRGAAKRATMLGVLR